MLMQGSAKYDQAMLADTLSRSASERSGRVGRGMVGELNDFATAFRPGMERSRAQEMVEAVGAKGLCRPCRASWAGARPVEAGRTS